ncbi:HAD-IIA family hydrolase [Gordonia shandongensis]|uniref:HAD-IIA family hydrolase n=1 Tax=Gordonia shandongensis TaxID=376351 RepID=UPI00047CFE12
MSNSGAARRRGGNRQDRSPRTGRRGDASGPRIPDDITAADLAPDVRRDLQALDKPTADRVARHLVAASALIDGDPEAALDHARAARARAARIAVVRETAGIVAYTVGEWQEAISELRAARRMSGDESLVALIADSERGLGQPERALEIADGADVTELSDDAAVELAVVRAGALIDLGRPEDAVGGLATEDLRPGRTGTTAARLFFAYGSALEAAGRRGEAITWFQNAAAADVDDQTDAEFRLMELVGDGGVAPASPTGAERDAGTLNTLYDALMFDLDGTLYTGATVLPHAVEAVREAAADVLFVTNNASRSPEQVAAHLTERGFPADADRVVTSAQAGARLVADTVGAGARVLVVGADALRSEITKLGLTVVGSADDEPDAVVQGHSPDTGWAELSEGALAIRAGATWIATNLDSTLPTERGLLVGNGSMVAAVAHATGIRPAVAGKPGAPIMRDALSRTGGRRPLMVGDRLDTDIEAGHTVGVDTLLVLTGVTRGPELLAAPPQQRPTYIATDLDGLNRAPEDVEIGPRPQWRIEVNGEHVSVGYRGDDAPDGDDVQTLAAALAHAVWTADVGAFDLRIAADDERSAAVLDRLGVTALR